LANAVGQPRHLATDTPPSRASPLPQKPAPTWGAGSRQISSGKRAA
ncbi:manganese ABC transporter ATP-binding protein, partial [Pseudomonas sp. GP01-A5]